MKTNTRPAYTLPPGVSLHFGTHDTPAMGPLDAPAPLPPPSEWPDDVIVIEVVEVESWAPALELVWRLYAEGRTVGIFPAWQDGGEGG
jgi:hypothetical protein